MNNDDVFALRQSSYVIKFFKVWGRPIIPTYSILQTSSPFLLDNQIKTFLAFYPFNSLASSQLAHDPWHYLETSKPASPLFSSHLSKATTSMI